MKKQILIAGSCCKICKHSDDSKIKDGWIYCKFLDGQVSFVWVCKFYKPKDEKNISGSNGM